MLIKFNPDVSIQSVTLTGTGTAFFERDGNFRGMYLDNTSTATATLTYFPNLEYSNSHKITFLQESVISGFFRAGYPFLGNNRSQLVYQLGNNCVLTVYYTFPHLGY